MQDKYIQNRNLVVVNTFDEFTDKLNQIDSNVEDIVGYITSMNMIVYGANIESIWGPLGFTWDYEENMNTQESILYPSDWKKLEHIISTGLDIDNPNREPNISEQLELNIAQKHRNTPTKKGYGHFNASTIPFTIIPKLPDGYRIIELKNTFNQIQTNYIEVKKSDWSNLKQVSYLVGPRQSIKIDLTGANFDSSLNQAIIGNTAPNSSPRYTVYIKGDLSNCTQGAIEGNSNSSPTVWTSCHTILLDEENKGINIPTSLFSANQYYCTIEDEPFDITEWLSISNTPTCSKIQLLAKSKEYLINWKWAESINNSYVIISNKNRYGNVQLSPFGSLGYTPETWDEEPVKISNPISQEITPSTVTIDTTGSTGNIREDVLVGLNNGRWYYRNITSGSTSTIIDYNYYNSIVLNPINYQGTVNSITMWNPLVVVRDDNSWPEFNQALINKLDKFIERDSYGNILVNDSGLSQGYFMYGSYLYITKGSPYTIDCTNLQYLNLFERARFFINDTSNLEVVQIGNNSSINVIELVKLTNATNLISFDTAYRAEGIDNVYIKVPSLKTVFWNYDHAETKGKTSYYIPSTSKIEASWFPQIWYTPSYIQDSTAKVFKVRKIDCRQYGGTSSMVYRQYNFRFINIPNNIYDFMEFEDGILNDIDFLKASYFYNFISVNNAVLNYPIVCCNKVQTLTLSNINLTINSDVYIYNTDIEIINYKGQYTSESPIIQLIVNKIIPGIIPNDTGSGCTFKLSTNIYNVLPEEQKNYIRNTLNYTLSEDL